MKRKSVVILELFIPRGTCTAETVCIGIFIIPIRTVKISTGYRDAATVCKIAPADYSTTAVNQSHGFYCPCIPGVIGR